MAIIRNATDSSAISERNRGRLNSKTEFSNHKRLKAAALLGAALLLAGLCGCSEGAAADRSVVVYTSVDQPFAARILAEFERRSGIRVRPLYDTEAGKTTGFVRRLEREADRSRCDVWWSSELFGTIELARAGLLEACESPAAADIPRAWRDPQGRWTGFAARARVLALDPRRVDRDTLPQTWAELARPPWAARSALADPQFGTTRGHIAALFAYHGEAEGRALLQSLREARSKLADGNAHAVRLIASGEADLAWTDTDDVWAAQRRGEPLNLFYPAISPNQPPLWIPCSAALVRGAPNPQAARLLLDYLVSADVERMLAESDSRNVPVREALRNALGEESVLFAPQPLDFERIADAMPQAMLAARDILLR